MSFAAGVELRTGDKVEIEFTPAYSGLPIRVCAGAKACRRAPGAHEILGGSSSKRLHLSWAPGMKIKIDPITSFSGQSLRSLLASQLAARRTSDEKRPGPWIIAANIAAFTFPPSEYQGRLGNVFRDGSSTRKTLSPSVTTTRLIWSYQ
jgi:hypothetical protein